MAEPLHVLLVAGSEVDAPPVLRALQEAGYAPKAALAATDAALADALRHRPWDVALFVPGAHALDGRLAAVRAAQPDVPVVVVGAGDLDGADEVVPAATADWLGPAVSRVLAAAAPISLDDLLLAAAPRPATPAAPAPEPAPEPAALDCTVDDRLRVVQDMAAHLPIGLYQSTPDGRILYANEALAGVLGFPSLDDLSTLDVRRDLGYPREHFEEQMRRFGEVRNLVVRWTDPRGRTVYTRENARVVHDDTGAVLYFEGTMEDVTAEHTARERDRQRTDQLAAIVRFATAVDEARDLRAVLDAAAAAVEATTGAPRVVVMTGTDTDEPLLAVNEAAEGVEWHALLAQVPFADGPCLALDLARDDGPLPAAVRAPLRARGVAALAAFPLFHFGRVHGAFYLVFDRPAVPAGEDVQVAETLAWHIAGALARHRAEAGLRDSEACLRFIGEHTDHVLYRRRYDAESPEGGTFDYLSPAVEALLGFAPSELDALGGLGALVEEREVVEGEGLMEGPPSPERLAGDGTPPRYVARYRMQTRTGEARWVENLAYVWCDEAGAPVGLIGTLTDATERRRHEEERAAAAVCALEQQRALVELGALGDAPTDAFVRQATELTARVIGVERVSVWEVTGEVVVCHDLYLDGAHVPEEAIDRDRVDPWLRALDEQRSIAVADAAAAGDAFEGMTAYYAARGIDAFLIAPVRRHGRAVGLVAITECGRTRAWTAAEQDFAASLSDLLALAFERAERVRIEAAFREEERRYRAVSELTSDYAFALRRYPDGRDEIVWATDAFARVTGYRPDEVDGSTGLLGFIHPDYTAGLQSAFARLVAGKAVDVEVCIRTKSGEERWVHHRARPGELDADGAIVFYHGGEDVTERKRSEQALIAAREEAEEMARLKSAFLANMSHEIRTPLTGILGYAGILAEEVDETHRESVELIERCGHRLLDTLNSVLELARLEGSDVQPEVEVLDLTAEAQQAVRLLTPLAARKGLDLALRADAAAHARLDRTCLARILNNLVGNAIKFTERGRIDVEVTTTAEHVRVRVADTGVGIDDAFLPHLFDEFRQETLGHGRSHEGVGLGLSITHRLVTLLGGTVDVESTKGEGSAFTVAFPLHRLEPDAAPEPATDEPAASDEPAVADEAAAVDEAALATAPAPATEEPPAADTPAAESAPSEPEAAPDTDAAFEPEAADLPEDDMFDPAFDSDPADAPSGVPLLDLIFPSDEPAPGDGSSAGPVDEPFFLRWHDEGAPAPEAEAPAAGVPQEEAGTPDAPFLLSDLPPGTEGEGVFRADETEGPEDAVFRFVDDEADAFEADGDEPDGFRFTEDLGALDLDGPGGSDGASWLLGADAPAALVVSPAAEPPPSVYAALPEDSTSEAMAPDLPPPLPAPEPADARPAILVVEDNDDTRALLEHILRAHFRVTAVGDARSALDHLHRTPCDGLVLDINLGGKQTGADILRIARTLPGNEEVFAVALTAYALPGDRERFLQAGFSQYVSKPFTRSTLMAALREGVPGAA